MIKGVMGDANFQSALSAYVAAYRDKSVRHEFLLDKLDEFHVSANRATVGDLKNNILKWITQPGYPVLTVSRDYDPAAPADKITYTQGRFLLSGTPDATSTWSIPFTLTTGITSTTILADVLEATKKHCWLSGGATGEGKVTLLITQSSSKKQQKNKNKKRKKSFFSSRNVFFYFQMENLLNS